MSFAGPPLDGPLSVQDFHSQALQEADAGRRRRLFADARQSNPHSHEIWVKAAEVEEHWGADEPKLKELLTRGVTVFKNPAGAGCTEDHDHSQHGFAGPATVDKNAWLHAANASESSGKNKTAAALKQAVSEVL